MPDFDHTKLRRLDLMLLLVFDEAMRRRKLSAVAERLGLTQSAISHSVGRLRETFGDELFVRRPHGVEPTARARALHPEISAVLERLDRAVSGETAFDPGQSDRVFRLTAPDLEAVLMAPALMRLREVAPGVRFTVRPQARREALKALRDGESDLALGYFWDLPPDLNARTLYREDYVVVFRRGHPVLAREFDLHAYAALDHVLVSAAGDLRGVVDTALEARGLERRVVAAVPYFFAALAAVAESDVVATLPRRLVRAHAERFALVWREPPMPIRDFPVLAVSARWATGDKGIGWLIEALADGTTANA